MNALRAVLREPLDGSWGDRRAPVGLARCSDRSGGTWGRAALAHRFPTIVEPCVQPPTPDFPTAVEGSGAVSRSLVDAPREWSRVSSHLRLISRPESGGTWGWVALAHRFPTIVEPSVQQPTPDFPTAVEGSQTQTPPDWQTILRIK